MRFTSDELEPLDQYYATRELAKECCDLLDFTKYNTILEPSAGTGAFLEFLPREKTQAIDLEPKHPDIIKMDFFDYSNSAELVVGGPPFGDTAALAVRFFNKAAVFADTIAFILPRTINRKEIVAKLNKNFHKTHEHYITPTKFIPPETAAHCYFQIWERREYTRNDR